MDYEKYTVKGQIHTDKSIYYGLNDNPYSLSFVDLLMAIPGISENKAAAIVKKYHTITNLIQSYLSLNSENLWENMLTDVFVLFNLKENLSKPLGKALSKKVYLILT